MRPSEVMADMLDLFEAHPDGITLDGELVGYYRVALEEVIQAVATLERAALDALAERADTSLYGRAVVRQRMRADAIPLDAGRRVIALPDAVRAGVAFSDGGEP